MFGVKSLNISNLFMIYCMNLAALTEHLNRKHTQDATTLVLMPLMEIYIRSTYHYNFTLRGLHTGTCTYHSPVAPGLFHPPP